MIRAFFLLLLANGLLLFIHYNEAGSRVLDSADQFTYEQEIEVMNRADGLYIRHHFTNLPDNHLEINWPKESVDRACYLAHTDACFRLNDEATAFEAGDETKQSISYKIPHQNAKQDSILFKEVFAKIHGKTVGGTVFHLTDEQNLEGTWVNGLVQIGHKKMDLVDYSLFHGAGSVSDLYWQKGKESIQLTNDYLTVYGTPHDELDDQKFEEVTQGLNKLSVPHTTIMLGNKNGDIRADRFLIKKNNNLKVGIDQILLNHLRHTFKLPEKENWTTELVASLLTEQAVGSKATHQAYELLATHFTVEEMEEMIKGIREKRDEEVNANLLGDLFTEVTGFKTSFFEKNKQATKEVYPLLLEDPRNLYVNAEKPLSKGVILKEGKFFYPAKEILSEIGYEFTQNDRSFYLKSPMKNYRFPLKENFYVYNDRRFNVQSSPFERIEDEFYFEEALFIRVFHVEIDKTTEEIKIDSIIALEKEMD